MIGEHEKIMGLRNKNSIRMFLHCGLCLGELPDNTSPREFAQLEVGFTEPRLQVWCKRHECNVIHIDFEGQKHPADTTIPRPKRRL